MDSRGVIYRRNQGEGRVADSEEQATYLSAPHHHRFIVRLALGEGHNPHNLHIRQSKS